MWNWWSHFRVYCCVCDALCYVGSKFFTTPLIAYSLIRLSGTFQESDGFAGWTSANRHYGVRWWIYKAPARFSSWFALPGFAPPSRWNYPILFFSRRTDLVSNVSLSFYCGAIHKEKSKKVQTAEKTYKSPVRLVSLELWVALTWVLLLFRKLYTFTPWTPEKFNTLYHRGYKTLAFS